MNKKMTHYYMDVVVSLSILVPAPGRFACGLVLVVELNILIAAGILMQYLIRKLKLEQLRSVILMTFFLCMAIIMKLLLVFLSPIMALQLGFVMYLPALSSYLISYFFCEESEGAEDCGNRRYIIKNRILHNIEFSLFALCVFLFRDIVGYGTLTLPIFNGMKEIIVSNPEKYSLFTFFATIPGVLLSTLILWVLRFLYRKFYYIEKSDNETEDNTKNG